MAVGRCWSPRRRKLRYRKVPFNLPHVVDVVIHVPLNYWSRLTGWVRRKLKRRPQGTLTQSTERTLFEVPNLDMWNSPAQLPPRRLRRRRMGSIPLDYPYPPTDVVVSPPSATDPEVYRRTGEIEEGYRRTTAQEDE